MSQNVFDKYKAILKENTRPIGTKRLKQDISLMSAALSQLKHQVAETVHKMAGICCGE
jgi:hypothetical protein